MSKNRFANVLIIVNRVIETVQNSISDSIARHPGAG